MKFVLHVLRSQRSSSFLNLARQKAVFLLSLENPFQHASNDLIPYIIFCLFSATKNNPLLYISYELSKKSLRNIDVLPQSSIPNHILWRPGFHNLFFSLSLNQSSRSFKNSARTILFYDGNKSNQSFQVVLQNNGPTINLIPVINVRNQDLNVSACSLFEIQPSLKAGKSIENLSSTEIIYQM